MATVRKRTKTYNVNVCHCQHSISTKKSITANL